MGAGGGVVPQLINNDRSLNEHLTLSCEHVLSFQLSQSCIRKRRLILMFASPMCDEQRILPIIKRLLLHVYKHYISRLTLLLIFGKP